MGPVSAGPGAAAWKALGDAIVAMGVRPEWVTLVNPVLAEVLGPGLAAVGMRVRIAEGGEPREMFWEMMEQFQ
jgi:hypothetical protein